MDTLNKIQDKILDIQKLGLLYFKPLKKNVVIKSFHIEAGQMMFNLQTKAGDGHDAECDLDKVDKFLTNFEQPVNLPASPNKKNITPTENTKTENSLSNLRSYLFDAIRKLEGGTMKIEQAKAMASVAQVILNSKKLEIEYVRLKSEIKNIELMDL